MKYKNYFLYFLKKNINKCINCNYCIQFCPKFKIFKKKNIINIKNCKICFYCKIKCKINCII
ncbi:MAG: 4Fe-4S dicluster domain-containing protein [Candidatus Carsonella ruddii]